MYVRAAGPRAVLDGTAQRHLRRMVLSGLSSRTQPPAQPKDPHVRHRRLPCQQPRLRRHAHRPGCPFRRQSTSPSCAASRRRSASNHHGRRRRSATWMPMCGSRSTASPAAPTFRTPTRSAVLSSTSQPVCSTKWMRLVAPVASRYLTFPNPVNELAARSVAGMVVVLTALTLVLRSEWLLWALAIGFLLRVAAGPDTHPSGSWPPGWSLRGSAPPGWCPGRRNVRPGHRRHPVGGGGGDVLRGRTDRFLGARRVDHRRRAAGIRPRDLSRLFIFRPASGHGPRFPPPCARPATTFGYHSLGSGVEGRGSWIGAGAAVVNC